MGRKQPNRSGSKPAVATPAPPATDAKKEADVKKSEPAPAVSRNNRATTSTTKPAAEKPKPAPVSSKKKVGRKKSNEPDPKKYAKLVATLPDCRNKDLANESERDEPIWINPPNFLDSPEYVEAVHEYVTEARVDTGMGIDQALYNLLKKNYDIPAATRTVYGFVNPRPIPWSNTDREIFRRCFAAYGKNFMKIQEIMNHKTKREVVAHYYNSKQEEQYKSSANNIGPDEVDFGDSDDDGDVRKANCQLCTKERSLLNCNGDLICKSCRVFKDEMEDFDEEVELYDFPDDAVPRVPNECPPGWEVMMHDAIKKHLHEPISFGRFEELKEKELERVKNLVNTYGEGETLEEVLRDKPRQYGVFFLNQDHPPTNCQTDIRLLRNETGDRILRIQKMEEELEKELDELLPVMESIEVGRLAHNKKKKADPKPPRVRYSAQWSEQEIAFACGAFFRYGMDYKAVSAIVRTKSADMCKAFYEKYKKHLAAPVQKREDYLNEGLVQPKT